jgi:hypothetical protein
MSSIGVHQLVVRLRLAAMGLSYTFVFVAELCFLVRQIRPLSRIKTYPCLRRTGTVYVVDVELSQVRQLSFQRRVDTHKKGSSSCVLCLCQVRSRSECK